MVLSSSNQSRAATQDKESRAQSYIPLKQFGGFSLGLLHCRKIGIGILPECQEIPVNSGRSRAIPGSGQSSGQLEPRHRSHRIVQHDSGMIQNLLKFSRCLAMAAHPGICKATHVDRIHRSEKCARIKGCAGNSDVIRCRHLRHFERFRCVNWVERLVESFERPQSGQVTELDRCVLLVALCEIQLDLVSLCGVVQKRRSRKPAWRDKLTAPSDRRSASFKRPRYADVRASWCSNHPWASIFA